MKEKRWVEKNNPSPAIRQLQNVCPLIPVRTLSSSNREYDIKKHRIIIHALRKQYI